MFKKIIISISLLSIFFISYLIINSYNNNNYGNNMENNFEDLQELNYLFYHSIKIKDYTKSQLITEKISTIFVKEKDENIFEDRDIQIINSSLTNMNQVLTDNETNQSEILYYASQLYLAIDALSHREQPLWNRYYSIINQDIEEIKEAMNTGNNKSIDKTIQNLQKHYNLIKPAILISQQSYLVENIDSLINALVKQNLLQNKEMILNQLDASIHQVFYGDEFDTMGSITIKTFIWKASFGIGLIIFVVLSYVIWRKSKPSLFLKK